MGGKDEKYIPPGAIKFLKPFWDRRGELFPTAEPSENFFWEVNTNGTKEKG